MLVCCWTCQSDSTPMKAALRTARKVQKPIQRLFLADATVRISLLKSWHAVFHDTFEFRRC